LHKDDFDRELSNTEEFNQYLSEHYDSFVDKAGCNSEEEIRALASKNVAINNAEWNSYWRGNVAGGLTAALSMMQPEPLTPDWLRSVCIEGLGRVDLGSTHFTVVATIDRGPVTQEEQREITHIMDEAALDLRRRGASWAISAAILTLRFPDVESFVRSLAGENNLIWAAKDLFPSRQCNAVASCLGEQEHHFGIVLFIKHRRLIRQ